jgi:hypothetical protein
LNDCSFFCAGPANIANEYYGNASLDFVIARRCVLVVSDHPERPRDLDRRRRSNPGHPKPSLAHGDIKDKAMGYTGSDQSGEGFSP